MLPFFSSFRLSRSLLRFSFVSFLCLARAFGVFSIVISLVRSTFWDRLGRRAKGELVTGRHRADSRRETKKNPAPLLLPFHLLLELQH